MLKLFRSSKPASVIAIIFMAFGVWSWSIWSKVYYPCVFDTVQMPFYAFFYDLIAPNAILSHIITLLLVLVIGFYLLRINEKFLLIKQRSYMPMLFMVLVSSSIFPVQRLNPAIFAALFIVIALNHIYALYLKKDALDNIFRATISLSLSTLFYAPTIIICLLIFIGLLLLRSLNVREWVVALIGLLLPIGVYLFALFFVDQPYSNLFDSFVLNLYTNFNSTIPRFVPLVFAFFIGIPLLSAIYYLIPSMTIQKISVRKYQTINLWLLLLTALVFFVVPNVSYEIIYIAAIPLSFQFTNFFMNIRLNIWTRLLFMLIVIGVVLVPIFYMF